MSVNVEQHEVSGIRGPRSAVAVALPRRTLGTAGWCQVASLIAIWWMATVASMPSAVAATYTWTKAGGDDLWSTPGNWTPVFTQEQPLDLVFNDGNGNGTNDLASGTVIHSMTFTSTAETHGFANNDGANPALNTMVVAAGGNIFCQSNYEQEIEFRLQLANALQVDVTGAGNILLGNLSGASTLTKTGGGFLGLTNYWGGGGYVDFTGNIAVQGGTMRLEQDIDLPNTVVTVSAGAKLMGGGSSVKSIISSGTLAPGYLDGDPAVTGYALSMNSATLQSTSLTQFVINGTQGSGGPGPSNSSLLFTGTDSTLAYGGTASVEFTNNSVYPVETTWDLFAAAPGATVDRTGVLAGFTTTGVGPYAGLTFTKFDPGTGSGDAVWLSDWAGNTGSKLVFNEATGQLVVVPEPSTIVFAGMGAAMSGWSMWRRRMRRTTKAC